MGEAEAGNAGGAAGSGDDPKHRVFESDRRGDRACRPASPLVLGSARPGDRPEEELAGYRRALQWVFSRKGPVQITTDVICRLHALAQGGHSGDAGEWKRRNNEIVEILPSGDRRIRFVPTSARETPKEIALLCRSYQEACQDERVPPLLLVATFIFDFLCVHPFRDGNGRVSRLLTTLLLKTNSFEIARYISEERLVEDRKDEYYGILQYVFGRVA